MDPVTTATLLANASLQFDPLLVLLTESADTGTGSLFQPWIRGLNIGFLFALLFGEIGPERVTSRKKKANTVIAPDLIRRVYFDTLCWAEPGVV